MARIRITYFFKSDRGYGWSETFFSTAGTVELGLTRAKAVLPLRVNLLAIGSRLPYIRVSDDEIKRDAAIYSVPIGDQTGTLPFLSTSDIANTCLLVRVEATPIIRRSLALRGIPDDLVKDGGQYVPTAIWNAAFAAYALSVVTNGLAIKSRTVVGAVADIVNVGTSGPTGIVTITTAAAHGFVANDVINITGVKNATQVRGVQTVLGAPTATTFDIRVPRVVRPYAGGGKANKLGAVLTAISALLPVRVSHHNAGRPFDSPVGRRRVR